MNNQHALRRLPGTRCRAWALRTVNLVIAALAGLAGLADAPDAQAFTSYHLADVRFYLQQGSEFIEGWAPKSGRVAVRCDGVHFKCADSDGDGRDDDIDDDDDNDGVPDSNDDFPTDPARTRDDDGDGLDDDNGEDPHPGDHDNDGINDQDDDDD